jgi:hypothetical protein
LNKILHPSGILAGRLLANVEIKEREYSDAIAALEKLAGPKIEAMDPEMGSLYRGKLAVIDAQIQKCRDALSSNSGNAYPSIFDGRAHDSAKRWPARSIC